MEQSSLKQHIRPQPRQETAGRNTTAGFMHAVIMPIILLCTTLSIPSSAHSADESTYYRALDDFLQARVLEDEAARKAPGGIDPIAFTTQAVPVYTRALSGFMSFAAECPDSANTDDALYNAFLISKRLPPANRKDKYEPFYILDQLADKCSESPFMEEVHYEKSRIYYERKAHDQAEESLKRLLSAYPSSRHIPAAKYYQAMIYKDRGDHDNAIPAFQAFIKDYPGNDKAIDAGYHLGDSLYRLAKDRDYQPEPREHLKRITEQLEAIAATPQSQYAQKAREIITGAGQDAAVALMQRNTPKAWLEAKSIITAVIARANAAKSACTWDLNLLALIVNKINGIYMRQADAQFNYPYHNYNAAMQLYRKVLQTAGEIEAANPYKYKIDQRIDYRESAVMRQAECLKFLGKEDEAAKLLEEQADKFTGDSPLLAENYYQQGLNVMLRASSAEAYTSAIEHFSKVLKSDPTSDRADDAQYYIGYMYLRLGDTNSAKAALSKLVQNYPKSSRVTQANKFLTRIEAGKEWDKDD